MIKSEIIPNMLSIKSPNPFIPALIFNCTKDAVMVDISHGKREYGKSSFTLSKMIRSFSNLLFNNSSLLLRLVAYTGITFSICSFLFGLFLIIKKLLIGSAYPGWTSLMVLLLFTSGLVLLSIGIVGEYLVRIIRGVEQKPSFIIRKVV